MHRWIVDSKAFEYDRHYSDCRKNNHPFIKARKNLDTGKYLIFLDFATCDYVLSVKQQQDLKILFESVSDKSGSYSCTTKEYCTFDGVSPIKLDEFLSQTYNTIQKSF